MATRASVTCKINGFWTYKQGWNWTDGSGSSWKYFGNSAYDNEDFGPMCISFYIPSSQVSNLSGRNPKIKLSFSAYNIISGYGNDATLGYYITTKPRKDGKKEIQGSENTYRKSAINEISVNIKTSSTTITTEEIKLINNPEVGTTYYCWFYIKENDVRKYQAKNISATVTYDAYTKCSAPTSISFKYNNVTKSSPYTHPSDKGTTNITLQWSGAKAGTGMSIKGYTVQEYNETESKWETKTTLTASASSGSYSIPKGQRGTSRTYRVITKGSVDGYDSSASSSAYIYFNSKPNSPSAKDIIVSSNTTSTYIPITIPITNYSFKTNTRTMKLWWKSSTQPEWKNSGMASRTDKTWVYNFPVENIDTTLDYGAHKQYYFKMVDNFRDESAEILVTLTRSVPLEVNSFTAELDKSDNTKMIVNLKAETDAYKDSVKIELMKGGSSVSMVTIPWKEPTKPLQVNLLTEGPSYKGSAALTYKFSLNVSDNFGDKKTEEATYPNGVIDVAALPNSGNVTLYNTLNGANIEITGVSELRYFDKIRAEFGANLLMTSEATLKIGDNSTIYKAKFTNLSQEKKSVLKFELNTEEILKKLTPSALKGSINFSFSLGTKITNSFSKTIYFSPRPSITIIPPSPTFKMYSQSTGTFQINGNFDDFGLNNISITGIKTLNQSDLDTKGYKIEKYADGYKIDSFNLADLFPLTGFNAESRKGTIIKRITLEATNVLEVTQTAGVDITLDFRKTPDNIKITTITYGVGTPSNLGELSLCEGTIIQVPFTYTSYGGDAIRFAVYWNDIEKASTTVTPMEGGKVAGAENVAGKPNNEGSLSFTVPPIPFGKETANIVIKANLVNSSATSSSNLMKPNVSPYEDSGMNVLSSNLDGNTLTLNCSLNAQGKGTYNYNLQFDENSVWITKINQSSPSPFIFEAPPTTNQVARIEITYTYPNNTTRVGETIESYSNTFVIFAASPTVSYRKNYLGINNTIPAEDTVIDINSFANRNKIKFSSPTEAIIELIASSDGPQLIFTKKVNNGSDIIYTLTFD